MRHTILLILVTLLSACASQPKFNLEKVDKSLIPDTVLKKPDVLGTRVLWGGMILTTRNLKESTQLEILAYPLDGNHFPQKDKEPMGRFIISVPGYLEPTLYTQGKLVTTTGKVLRIEKGKVGESEYSYPYIQSDQLHLWSNDSRRVRTSVHFGIGIGL